MYVDRVIYPVNALGPGNRVAIWVAGCNRRCIKCANPELWYRHDYQRISSYQLASNIEKTIGYGMEGITITGGEPFDQAEELADMLERLSEKQEILVFTGYLYEDLVKKAEVKRLLDKVDVLVDGEYIDELNDNFSTLRGSSNQRIIYLNESVRQKYEDYIKEGRKIQNFIYDYNTVSVGIHNRENQM